MQRGNMNEEKEITESKISEMLSNLKTTEEYERGKGNMNEEKEITVSEINEMLGVNVEKDYTESEINEMLSNLKTVQERAVFLGSPIYWEWMRQRDQRFFEDCAKIGLAQYNGQNGTNFELEKISYEDHCFCPGVVYFHLNFIAESSDKKKRCMFFAEVVGFEERVVSVCCILDAVVGIYYGCRFCDREVCHPSGCSFLGCRPT